MKCIVCESQPSVLAWSSPTYFKDELHLLFWRKVPFLCLLSDDQTIELRSHDEIKS